MKKYDGFKGDILLEYDRCKHAVLEYMREYDTDTDTAIRAVTGVLIGMKGDARPVPCKGQLPSSADEWTLRVCNLMMALYKNMDRENYSKIMRELIWVHNTGHNTDEG